MPNFFEFECTPVLKKVCDDSKSIKFKTKKASIFSCSSKRHNSIAITPPRIFIKFLSILFKNRNSFKIYQTNNQQDEMN